MTYKNKFSNITLKNSGTKFFIWSHVQTDEKSIAKIHKKSCQKSYPYFHFTLRKIKPGLFGIYMSRNKRKRYGKRPKSV